MNILYEDNHLLVVEKPVNIPVQLDSSGDVDLLSMLKAYIKEKYNKPGDVFLGLVHRLDRPVGGIMVFARTSKAASRLMPQFASHQAKKRYMAVVTGKPCAQKSLLGFIKKDERTGNALLFDKETDGAKPASLNYYRSMEKNGLTLLDVELFTGRHHQIRAQLSGDNIPIWGDQRYNKTARPGEQIALFAYSLSFFHPTTKERLTFTLAPKGGVWDDFFAPAKALTKGVRLVYQDDNILCAYKTAGLSVAEDDGGDSLEARLNSAGFSVYPVHRLDIATEGLVLFALNQQAKAALDAAIKDRLVEKYYRAEVEGHFSSKSGELRAYLTKDAAAARVKVTDKPTPSSKEIITRYRVLEQTKHTSIIEVELVTGRTHQIRAHMAHVGHPLIGDDKYNSFAADKAAGKPVNFAEGKVGGKAKESVTDKAAGKPVNFAEGKVGGKAKESVTDKAAGKPVNFAEGKVGDSSVKSKKGLQLCAWRLCLHFEKDSPLSYLNGKTISVKD